MFGYVLATGRAQAVALHDCDITTYDRSMLSHSFTQSRTELQL